jgi:hypothetical protein
MSNIEAKLEKLISTSGNSFHFEVVNFLRDKGWEVLISPFYTDNTTDKPREIDIIAEKTFEIMDNFGQEYGSMNIQLTIECKYINDLTVFWFDKPDENKLNDKIVSDMSLNIRSSYEIGNHINASTPNHHYLKVEVAKLYTTNTGSKNEQEIMFKAINQSLSSHIYFERNTTIIKKVPQLKSTLRYPMIVCKNFDNFYRADNKKKIENNFLLEVNYAYYDEQRKSKEEYFLIDVINFEKFEDFLNMLEANEARYDKLRIMND